MFMTEIDVNFLAVLVAGVVQFGIGSFWYSPVMFAKPWMRLMKINPEEMKPSSNEMAKIFGVSLVGSIVMAYILAHFAEYAGAINITDGLMLGFWAWLGFIVTTHIHGVLYEKKPWALFAINMGHYLACFLAAGAILAIWR